MYPTLPRAHSPFFFYITNPNTSTPEIMTDTSTNRKGHVEVLPTLVELSNRIESRADYEVVVAAFSDLDDDTTMAAYSNTNITETTTNAGSQPGTNNPDLTSIQAKVKHLVLVFARSLSARRTRRGQPQDPSSPDSIVVTKEDITMAKKAALDMIWELPVLRLVAEIESAEQQDMEDRRAAEIARLEAVKDEAEARIAKLEAEIREMKAKRTGMEARSRESGCEFPLLEMDMGHFDNIQGKYGGDGASDSQIGGAEEYDVVSIEEGYVSSFVADFGSDTEERTLFFE